MMKATSSLHAVQALQAGVVIDMILQASFTFLPVTSKDQSESDEKPKSVFFNLVAKPSIGILSMSV